MCKKSRLIHSGQGEGNPLKGMEKIKDKISSLR